MLEKETRKKYELGVFFLFYFILKWDIKFLLVVVNFVHHIYFIIVTHVFTSYTETCHFERWKKKYYTSKKSKRREKRKKGNWEDELFSVINYSKKLQNTLKTVKYKRLRKVRWCFDWTHSTLCIIIISRYLYL